MTNATFDTSSSAAGKAAKAASDEAVKTDPDAAAAAVGKVLRGRRKQPQPGA